MAIIYTMKKKVLASALLLLLPFVLTACTLQDLPVIGKFFAPKTPPKVQGPVTLNVWGMFENPEVMSALIKKYQAGHPTVTINYDDRSILKPKDYRDRVFSRIGQENTADIILVHASWVSALKGNLAPASDKLLNAQTFSNSFYPAAVQTSVFDGKVYAMPLYYDGLALVYNKAHFAEVGQQDPPTAWEEFRRLALKLKKEGVLVRGGAAIGTASNIDFSSDILGMLFAQAKINIPADMDSKAAQDALSFYANFVKEDRVWNESFPEASAAFAQEKVSMIFEPSWSLLDIIKSRPDLDIGVAAVPQAIPEEPASWATFWTEVVPSSSPNKDAAWDFLNFLGQKDQEMTMFSEASKYRQYGAPYSLKALAPELASNKYLKSYLDIALYSKTGIVAARAGNDTVVDAVKEAVNAVLSGGDPAAALQAAKAKASQ